MNTQFSFIILTFNEEYHLKRLLSLISKLNAQTFVIDSGSSDRTLDIANEFNCTIFENSFVNHPQQWHFALNNCSIQTPWIIGLDSDQYPGEELMNSLEQFKDANIASDINGIFFNRHNYFGGKRLRFGGYGNFYMLKMFRTGLGYSDLNELMDHRFVVPGKTIVWRKEFLIEDNIKENDIDFWIAKHIKYSKLVAMEEYERMKGLRNQTNKPKLFGNPDERKALLKKVWWDLPLYFRPFIYFFYRFFIRGGILESKEGRIFHFLQSFWFRLLVDIKKDKLIKGNTL